MSPHPALLAIALGFALAASASGCKRDASAGNANATATALAQPPWQAGVHYEVMTPFTGAENDKATVTQFFWFGCPHCYTFEPHLVLWNRKKPPDVTLMRIPTTWGPYDRPHAQLYYTLEVLGRSDLHADVFDTIHREGNRLQVDDAEETLALQIAFAQRHGIDEERFVATYRSAEVQARLQHAEQVLRHYKVARLPTFVVNGKYKTDVTRTGRNPEALMSMISDLAQGERDGRDDSGAAP